MKYKLTKTIKQIETAWANKLGDDLVLRVGMLPQGGNVTYVYTLTHYQAQRRPNQTKKWIKRISTGKAATPKVVTTVWRHDEILYTDTLLPMLFFPEFSLRKRKDKLVLNEFRYNFAFLSLFCFIIPIEAIWDEV